MIRIGCVGGAWIDVAGDPLFKLVRIDVSADAHIREELDPVAARELARWLVAAADEAERR